MVGTKRASGAAAVAVGLASSAVLGAIPAAPAAAGPFTLLDHCAAGSGTVTASVDCRDADTPLIAGALAAAAPQIVGLLGDLGAPATSTAAVIAGDGTARIHGTGLAVAVQTSSSAFLGIPGGTAEANAVTPLSAAVAGAFLRGSADATAVSGSAVALSGSGTARALAVGGSATALNALGARAVRCVALYATASADGVGSCTSILVVFTAETTAGSPVTTYAVVDPTSFRVTTIGAVPVPEFTRDLVRVSVGGPEGVTVGSDVVPGGPVSLPTTTSTPTVTTSARAALASEPVTSMPTPSTTPRRESRAIATSPSTSTPPSTQEAVETAALPQTSSSTPQHAKDDDDTTSGFTIRSTSPTAPASTTTAPGSSIGTSTSADTGSAAG